MNEPVLGYATNCYAGESAAELIAAVRTEVAAVRQLLPAGEPLNLSLRIGAGAAREMEADPGLVGALREALSAAGAAAVGANAFPISAPQNGVYKDGIYAPDWRSPERRAATLRIARAVAGLLPAGARGVLTTLTGSYRPWSCPGCAAEADAECAAGLRACAGELDRLSAETGRDLVLALEPEPFTTAESLPAALADFGERLYRAPGEAAARRRLALNLDLCHSAVMFEDAAGSLREYVRAGVPVAGLHVSAALRLPDPAGLVGKLRAFDEPKYLHQVAAVDRAGRVAFRSADLGEFLGLPAARLEEFAEARVHFHVPVYAREVGGLATTADQTWAAVRAARAEGLANLFVVETYTWPEVLGRGGAAAGVAEGIARELAQTREVLGG